MLSKKSRQLKHIKEEVLALKQSPLYAYRLKNGNFPVIGEGNHDADLVFVGEAPGKNEARLGRPFCGRAGAVLDELLKEVGIIRSETYITNIVKDRPPDNRDPFPEEIAIYAPFLDRQIDLIKPKVVATLGRFSANYLLEKYSFGETFAMSRIHGKKYEKNEMDFKIIPLYHPAAIIYSPKRKEDFLSDLRFVKKVVEGN